MVNKLDGGKSGARGGPKEEGEFMIRFVKMLKGKEDAIGRRRKLQVHGREVEGIEGKIDGIIKRVDGVKRGLIGGRDYRRVVKGIGRAEKDFRRLEKRNEVKESVARIGVKNRESRVIEDTLVFYVYLR